MEQKILKKVEDNAAKLEKIYTSVEKTRKYFLWMLIISIVVIVLPLIALAFIGPWLISNITSLYSF
ncbi:hypothetical protein MYX07_03285 [Patescibacteria group bacterium AH-259-L07]|nr:hypothetical protein [Patescibacteria group bacterium AH-259-L07]